MASNYISFALRLYRRPVLCRSIPCIQTQAYSSSWRTFSSDAKDKEISGTVMNKDKKDGSSSSSSSDSSSSDSSSSDSSSSSSDSSSSDSSSSDSDAEDKKPKGSKMESSSVNAQQTTQQKEAAEKLNAMLTSMFMTSGVETKRSEFKINLPTAIKTFERRKERLEKKKQQKEEQKLQEQMGVTTEIVNAVKAAAEELGGDTVDTEIELLTKMSEQAEMTRKRAETTEKPMLDILQGMTVQQAKEQQMPDRNNSNAGYRKPKRGLDRKNDLAGVSNVQSAAEEISEIASAAMSINLFGSGTLNIFTKPDLTTEEKKEFPELKVWDSLEQRSLEQLVKHSPTNAFEEMILWTEQKKMWKFPIDNEQGMDEEAKSTFEDHIFLDSLLDEGFPKRGPIRHFMELVTTGLSHNPYLTVQEKHDHINWFKNYFSEKQQLLEELGVA